jgi:hypothetical protein
MLGTLCVFSSDGVFGNHRRRIIGAHGVKFQYCFHAKTQDVYLVTGCSLAVGTLQLRAGRDWL